MVIMKSLCLAALLSGFVLASSQAHRLAILPSPGNEDLESLLVVSISSSPDLELVERKRIDTLVREKRLEEFSSDPSKVRQLGELLGADSILFVERHGNSLISRLVAVGPALVVDEQISQIPIKDAPGWAKYTASHLQTALKSLPSQPRSALLLSVLGIRSPIGGKEARRQELECTALIENALSSLGGVFVLERARLQDSDFEKQISQSASTPYWTSAWLLDGSLTGPDDALTFEGRLQQTNGQSVQTFRVEAGSPAQLAHSVAAAVAEKLRTTHSEIRPQGEEAAMFQEEAEWAHRWRDYSHAERAAAASWALGNRSDSLAFLRAINAVDQYDWDFRLLAQDRFSTEPAPGMLDKIIEAFSYVRQFTHSPETCSDPSAYVKCMYAVCKKATQALNTYYYLKRPRNAEEDESLRHIRSEIRRHLPLLTSRVAMLGKERIRKEKFLAPNEFPLEFLLLYGQFAPLWFDNPKSSSQGFLDAYRFISQLEPSMSVPLLVEITVKREEHMPLTVAWRPDDRAQAIPERQDLITTIAASGPSGKLDAVALNLSRFYHPFNRALVAMVPLEPIVTAFRELQDAIWDVRENFVRGEIHEDQMVSLLIYACEIAEFRSYSETLRLQHADFRKKLLTFILERKWMGTVAVFNRLIHDQRFSSEECDRLVRLLSEMAKMPNAPDYISFLQEQITRASTGESAFPTPVAAQNSERKLPPAATYEVTSDSENLQIEFSIARESSFFLRQTSYNWLEINPVTGEKKPCYLNSERWRIDRTSWDVAGENFFLGTKDKLIRVNRNSGESTELSVPYFKDYVGILRVINGQVYASISGGGVVRIDPATGRSELLASARRRPAQSTLDDRAAFRIDKITETPQGPAFTIDGDRYFVTVWDDTTRNFRELPNALNSFRTYNPDFLLSWLRSEGEIQTSSRHMESYFLLDPQRTGTLPRFRNWPPPIKVTSNDRFQTYIVSSTANGDTVYILLRGGVDNSLYLKIMDKTRNISIPLDVSSESEARLDHIDAAESGVLLTGRTAKDALFFSRKDLDAFQP